MQNMRLRETDRQMETGRKKRQRDTWRYRQIENGDRQTASSRQTVKETETAKAHTGRDRWNFKKATRVPLVLWQETHSTRSFSRMRRCRFSQVWQAATATVRLPAALDDWLQCLRLPLAQLPSEEDEDGYLEARAACQATSQVEAQRCSSAIGTALAACAGAGATLAIGQLQQRLRPWLQGRAEQLYAPVPWRVALELLLSTAIAHAPPALRATAAEMDLLALEREIHAWTARPLSSTHRAAVTPGRPSPPPIAATPSVTLEESTFYVDGFAQESAAGPATQAAKRASETARGSRTERPSPKRPKPSQAGAAPVHAAAMSQAAPTEQPSATPLNAALAALRDALHVEREDERAFDAQLAVHLEGGSGSGSVPVAQTAAGARRVERDSTTGPPESAPQGVEVRVYWSPDLHGESDWRLRCGHQ